MSSHLGGGRFEFITFDFIFLIFYWDLGLKRNWFMLKGLGHAILGNFSIDQMVIELTEITK